MDDINSKIDELRKRYPDQEDQQMLSGWERQAKEAMLVSNLQQNDGVKLILENYYKELDTLNKILLSDESLFKDAAGVQLGLVIHARKRWCLRFISLFKTADMQKNSMVSRIDNSLEVDPADY